MKAFHWFFLLSLSFLLFIISLFFIDIPPGSTGMLHEKYATMLHGGPDTKGLSFGIGVIIGLMVLGIFAFCLYLGNRRKGHSGPLSKWFWAGIIGYFAVYGIQVYLYWMYDAREESLFFGGYPLPTAWMIYAMWTFPLVFTVIYLLTFDSWVFTKEDEAAYEALEKEINS